MSLIAGDETKTRNSTVTCTMRIIKTKAKTGPGIARAYLRQVGVPYAHEWSAGGSGPKGRFYAIPAYKLGREGDYILTAVSFFNGRPAGVIFGPAFKVVK